MVDTNIRPAWQIGRDEATHQPDVWSQRVEHPGEGQRLSRK